ncbi:MAG: hypothetical protein QXT81_02120 [Candidatus Bathyarchaeia archaeon]
MDTGLLAGLLGLIAGFAGLYAMLYAMGFFQYLGGRRRSVFPPVSREEMINKILDLNDPSKPYHIVAGTDSDLVAEWKIVDAQWYGVFNKSGLKSAYRALLQVDDSRHAVRCYEEFGSISWTAGLQGIIPKISYRKKFFGGRILYRKEYAIGYGLRQLAPPEPGKVYDYRFDVNEIRGPIILTVEKNGWEWVPVTAKRHVTCK